MAQSTAKPTQQLIDIEEIRDGVMILKNGGLRRILMVAGINFDLKSEEEQGLITYGYQNLLNALDFSLQFFIHSRKININSYLEKLTGRQEGETNELLKNQLGEYREFIRSLVTENPIMNKSFFVIVPFDPIQIPAAVAGAARKILGIFSRKESPAAGEEERQRRIESGLVQLNQRIDQVVSGLSQIGLTAAPLNTDAVVELFYNLYNPGTVEKKMTAESEK